MNSENASCVCGCGAPVHVELLKVLLDRELWMAKCRNPKCFYNALRASREAVIDTSREAVIDKWGKRMADLGETCIVKRADYAALEAERDALREALGKIISGEGLPEIDGWALGCGVEDRDLQGDGYDAAEYAWANAVGQVHAWAGDIARAALAGAKEMK